MNSRVNDGDASGAFPIEQLHPLRRRTKQFQTIGARGRGWHGGFVA
jgi:hypothetical protein